MRKGVPEIPRDLFSRPHRDSNAVTKRSQHELEHPVLGVLVPGKGLCAPQKRSGLSRSEGFPRTAYFVPACVWSGRQASFESCSSE